MVTHLRVRNFKSLKDVNFALGPLTALVGPNMGGKSNIVDVFYFIYQFLFPQGGVDGLNYALAQRGGISQVLWKGGDESLIAIDLVGINPGVTDSSWNYSLEVVAGTGGYAQIQKESFVLHEESAKKELIVLEGNVRWLANKDGQRISTYSSTTRSAMENVPDNWDGSALIKLVRLWRFYQLIPPLMKQANPTGAGFVLDRVGLNLSAWLMFLQTRFPEAFRRVSEAARDSFPELKALLTTPTAQGTVFLSSLEQGLKYPIDVGAMSDGELSFVALLSILCAPPELGASLYCLEEPENHLHPRLLSSLIRLTRHVRDELTAAGTPLAQLILTTHSPLLVDEMTLDEIVWVDKKDGETRTVRPGSQEHLCRLVADNELGLGDIVYSGLLSGPQ